MASNNWYVITGAPSTGKSTLLKELNNLGYNTVEEAARIIIDGALAKSIPVEELRSNEKRFQEDVLRLKEKTEATQNKSVLTFFDRGIQDTLAYMRCYEFSISKKIMSIMNASRYKKVFLLEPLSSYKYDYARTENFKSADIIQKMLYDVYSEFGMIPAHVPDIGLEGRVKFILDIVKAEQNI